MTERDRTSAFAAAVVVVAAVLILLIWVVPGPDADPRPEARKTDGADPADGATPRRPTVQDPAGEQGLKSTPAAEPAAGADRPAALDEDLPPGANPPPRPTATYPAAEDKALAFLRVFLRYEVGDLSPEVRAGITEHAAPRLARPLLAQPPRPPDSGRSPPPARVVKVDGVEAAARGGFDVITLIERAGEPTPLVVTVEPRRGRWLATAVG
jgi:hypothetical protein